MIDDTTNKALLNKAADPPAAAAETRTATNPSKEEARREEEARGTAALVARSLQARFAAVARHSIALALAFASAPEFTRASTGGEVDGFPVGSDYGVLYPQDDLDGALAEMICHQAAQDVRAEAERMTHGAPPSVARVIAEALAAWEEGAEDERANVVRVREEQDRDEEKSREWSRRQVGPNTPEKKLTPGLHYVVTYLQQEAADDADLSWVAESIDGGWLIACSHCHFLHLPFQPFPRSARASARFGKARDACDVCADVPILCDPINWSEDWEKALASAGDALADERALRAVALYRLWIGATDGAEALRVAAIAEALAALVKQARTPVEAEDAALKETAAAPGAPRAGEAC